MLLDFLNITDCKHYANSMAGTVAPSICNLLQVFGTDLCGVAVHVRPMFDGHGHKLSRQNVLWHC